jgi:hypothetical protein
MNFHVVATFRLHVLAVMYLPEAIAWRMASFGEDGVFHIIAYLPQAIRLAFAAHRCLRDLWRK